MTTPQELYEEDLLLEYVVGSSVPCADCDKAAEWRSNTKCCNSLVALLCTECRERELTVLDSELAQAFLYTCLLCGTKHIAAKDAFVYTPLL